MANKTLHSIISETIKGVIGRRTQYNGNKEQVQNDKQRTVCVVLFHWAIALSVPLGYPDSDYLFGNFKLFI
jgi:hypothetical protein